MALLINQLNTYFSILFLSWCVAILSGIPYLDLKEYTVPLWGFYAIIFVAILFNYIMSTLKIEQKHAMFFILGIIGFTFYTVGHLVVSCYFLGQTNDPDKVAVIKLGIIPPISNGIFGIVLSSILYYHKKHQNDAIKNVKVWKEYSIVTCYSIIAILWGTFILNFIYNFKGIPFRQDLIITHTAIVCAGTFMILAFVTFIREIYLFALFALGIAATVYGNLLIKMICDMIYSYNKGYPEDVIKGYFWFLHCYTILIFIITGIYICYSLGKYENSKEKANPKIKVIAQDIFPADPFTQKCMY